MPVKIYSLTGRIKSLTNNWSQVIKQPEVGDGTAEL
jgi:hypothetical protein